MSDIDTNIIYDHLQQLKYDVGYCKQQKLFSTHKQRIVILNMNKFSESINITTFSNLFLFNYNGNEECARQCIGRLQRTTNTTKVINVWFTSQNPSLLFSVIPPKSLVDDYTAYLGKKQGSEIGLTHLNESLFVQDMSMYELTAICRKSIKPIKTQIWLDRNNTHKYTSDAILSIIKGTITQTKPTQGCLISNMKPILVKYHTLDTVEQVEVHDTIEMDIVKLSQIIEAPAKRGSYTVAELKQFCLSKNLKVTGTKAELAKRLIDAQK